MSESKQPSIREKRVVMGDKEKKKKKLFQLFITVLSEHVSIFISHHYKAGNDIY